MFAFHCFYGFRFPFAVDGRGCSTPVRDGEAALSWGSIPRHGGRMHFLKSREL